jgi:hypothetical protein
MILATHGIVGSQITQFVGLLDLYPSAAAAYSLRKLRSAYTGNAIRVRRESDNAEQNIGFASNVLDTSSLTSFCSGTNGFITTWYDQSGNSRDASQTTASNQPQIVSTGSVLNVNFNPSIKFDGIDDRLFSNSFASINQPITLFNVRRYNINKTQISVFFSSGTPYGDIYFNSGTFQAFSGSFINSGLAVNFNQGLWYYLSNGTNSQVSLNNSSVVTADSGSQGLSQIYLGANASAFPTDVNLQEVIIYPSNQSSNRTGIQSNINSFYSIY